MEKKSIKALKIVTTLMLIFIIVGIVLYGLQTYFFVTEGGTNGVINSDAPNHGLKLGCFIAERLLFLAAAFLLIAFAKNILKSIKQGEIFNRCNSKILFALVVVLPIYTFVSDNMTSFCMAADKGFLILTDRPFIYTAVTLLVAILYKLACDTAEEQKLTI